MPKQRAHRDAPLRGFVRGEACYAAPWQLIERLQHPSPEVPLREGAAGPGLQITLEGDGSFLVGELDGRVELPRAVARRVRADRKSVV